MNKVHRIVWSDARQTWVVTHENAGTRGKPSSTRKTALAAAVVALWGSSAFANPGATALPTGGQVAGGAATITTPAGTGGARLDIVQSTPRAAIDWQSFNIGAQAQVHFNQPAGGATLNRVLGTDASQIFGKLTSTGQVFLVNPNGVLFAPGAMVDVGGLIASTRHISNADFMAGRLKFEGSSSGAIINQANITTAAGGTVALIAAKIVNSGSISAPAGQVLMGAGNKLTLDLGGPVKIQVEEGALEALIEQGGAIRADGGLVYLTARAAGTLATAAINQSGNIEAQALSTGEKGQIFLMADMAQGTLNVGGTLKAEGGFIETSAAKVQVQSGAVVRAGDWLIDPVDVTVDAAMATAVEGQLAAGNFRVATQTGPGNGDIFVNAPITWNSGHTLTLQAHRNIEINARLDASGGSGGKLNVIYGNDFVAAGNTAKFTVNAPVLLQNSGAANGLNGSTATNFSTRLGNDGATLNYTVLSTAAALLGLSENGQPLYALGADISLQGTTDPRPIGVTASPFYGSLEGLGHTVSDLSRSFSGNFGLFGRTFGAKISNLRIKDFNMVATAGPTSTAEVGALVGWLDGGSSLYNIQAENIVIDGTAGSNATGSGTAVLGGLVGSATGGSTISRVTATNISVSGRRMMGGIAGQLLTGSSVTDTQVDGLTLRISGYVNGASSSAGGIAGFIQNTTAAVSVARSSVRGLDINTSTGAYANGGIGGIAGVSSRGDITTSYAAGSIVANNNTDNGSQGGVGGVVGDLRTATLSNVYSLVDVKLTGSQNSNAGLGGLVGRSSSTSTITNAYATGKVESTLSFGDAMHAVGGFLGMASNTVVNAGYWDATTSGTTKGIGSRTAMDGQVAGTGVKSILTSSAHTQSAYNGFDFSNTWFMLNGETRPFLRMEWSPTISNVHQLQLMAMNLGASYTLARDIDLAPALNKRSEMWKGSTVGNLLGGSTFYPSFAPIGNENNRFSGVFDGQGHTLANLSIYKPDGDYVGLFGATSKAELRHIGLTGSNVVGRNMVGGLVGQTSQGTITQAYSSGNVRGRFSVGGLVGSDSGVTSNAHAAGTVTASSSGAGGLVGVNYGTLNHVYSSAAVNGRDSTGGLVGANSATISNAFSTGSVSGGLFVGGLVGTSTNSRITNTYSTGRVTGTNFTGGLIGANSGASTVTDSYWNTETSGQSRSAAGTGKTTAQLQDPATFSSWGSALGSDPSLSGNAYPQLRWTLGGLNAGTSAWVMAGPAVVTLSYTLGTASGSYTYQGSEHLLGGVWNAASIFGSSYSSWVAGTDYSFSYNGSTVTGFTNAGSYSNIGVNILKSGYALASSGNTAGSFTIDPKLLTGSIAGGGSVYGQALTGGTVTLSGVIGNDVVSAGAVAVATAGMTRSASLNWNAGTYADAQSVGTALNGASAANYQFAGATAAYTITPATVSAVTGISVVGKTYDGNTSATLRTSNAGFTGVLAGDSLTVATATGNYTNPNAGQAKAVSVSGITLGGASAANYSLANSSAMVLGDIGRKTITVANITAADKVYDGSTSATLDTSTAFFQGVIGNDVVNLATASGSFADKNAGSGKTVNIGGMTLGGAAAGNYLLGNDGERAYASITPKAVTVSGLAASDKTYDGSTSAQFHTGSATLNGLVGGDTPTLATVSGAFADANAGVGKTVTVHSISLAGAGAGNYTVSAADTSATIHKATLVVTANDFVSSGSATPAVLSQSGCVLANTCVNNISLSGANLGLNFATGQLASNYNTTLAVNNNAGSLTVARALNWSGFNLALSAAADIHIHSTLSAGGASDKLSLNYGLGAVAAGNPYAVRFGLTDAGFSGKAELQAGQNYSTRQGSDGSIVNWTVVTALGSATSSNDGTLQGITGTLAGNYVLGADIDASSTSGWNAGAGWTPLGNATTKFTGRFDGLGHVVSGLTINTSNNVSNSYQGLFGYAIGASLANVGVANASVTGARFMGALLGQGDTTSINQSYASNATLTGERGVGGLVGFLRMGSNINDSFATGETRGNGTADISFHGGLLGLAESWTAGTGNVAANIRRSFANVNVATAAGSDAARVAGGLVGLFRGAGVIEDSFALGSVRGSASTSGNGTGGLVGRLGTGGDTALPTVTRTYASGAVSTATGTLVGGLVGNVAVGSVSHSLWDTQTTGRATSAGGAGAVGKTSEQMQRLDTYTDAGWNVALSDAANYAGISDFRRAGQALDGSGQWRINPRYIAYTLPTIVAGNYSYDGQAQTPVEWNSRSILGAAFANWVLGTDYVLTSGGQNLTAITNAGNYNNLSITFLRGGAGHYQNTSSGNTLGSFTLDKATLVVRANDDARFVTQADSAGYAGVNYSGFVAGETTAALGGTLSIARSDHANNAAGSYTLTPSGLTSSNYAFTYQDGSYQIVAADKLLVKAGTVLSTYGQAVAYSSPTVQYVAGGTVLTLDVASQNGSSFVFAESGTPGNTVGFTLTPVGPGTSSSGWLMAGDYSLTGTGFNASTPNYTGGAGNVVYSGLLKVAPKLVSVSYDPSKTYDRSTSLAVAVNTSGVVAGDNFALAGNGQFSTSQAGSQLGYTLTFTPSGSDAQNYAVSGAKRSGSNFVITGNNGSIAQKALSVAGLTADSKVYDGSTLASFSGTAALTGGVVAGDSLSLSGSALGEFAGRNVGTSLAVSLSGLTLQGSGASNYLLTLPSNYTASITPASISAITGITAAGKVYDGSTVATLSTGLAGFTGLVAGDSLTVASASGNFTDRNAGTGKTVNITGLALGGTHAGNYTLASGTASTAADINPATLSAVTGLTAAHKVYDGSTSATLNTGAAAFTGMVSGDHLSVASASAAFADANAGSGKAVNISAITLGGTHAANYVLADNSASTSADISAKVLTMSGSTAAHKVYDGNTSASISAGTLSGLVGTETLALTATGSFADKNAGAAKTVAVSYSLADGSHGGLAGNYSLAGESLTADISQASATVTANSGSGVYSGRMQSVSGYTVSGLVGGDDASVLTGISVSGASGTNAGSYTSTASGTANNGNYALSFANGTLLIHKADATVIANSGSGTYTGLQQSVSGYTVSGLVNGETASVLGGVAAGGSGTNAGAHTTTASGSDANYNLNFVDGTLVINRAQATVTANSGSGTYTGLAQSISGYTVSGLVGGEDASVLSGLSSSGASGTNAGSYMHSVSGPAGNGNYQLSFMDGTLVIHKASATVTAHSSTGTYNGQVQSVSGYTVTGLVNGETASVLNGISASGASGTNADLYVNAALGDADNGNYQLNFINGVLNIQKAQATVTAHSGTGTYNGLEQNVSGYSVSGLVNGESASVITGVTAGVAATDAGRYASVASGSDRNYQLNFVDGSFVIHKANATVTANGGSTTYNGQLQTADGYTVSGLVNGETAAVLTGVSTTGASGSNAGSYANVASGVDRNYELSFVDGVLLIHKASVTVTGISAASKAYDGNTSVVLNIGSAGYSGLVAGDQLAVTGASGSFADKNAGSGKAVNITGITLGGASAGNYELANTTASTTADIQRLASVRWVGGASGHWFDPANWAGGAVPDLANVALVEIPAHVAIHFTTAGAVAPADASQAVNVDGISGTGTRLNMVDGRLNVRNNLLLAGYTQSGGTLGAGADFTVTGNFQQSGGLVDAAGSVAITQTEGDTTLAHVRAGGNLKVNAIGSIGQTEGGTLTVAGTTHLTSTRATVRLNGSGNRFASAPVMVQAGDGVVQATAIAQAQQAAASLAAPGVKLGIAGGATLSASSGTPQQSGGLVLVEATGSEPETGRNPAGLMRVWVVDGGIKLPDGVTPAKPAAAPR